MIRKAFYTSNKRDSKYMDLYEMSIDPFVSKIIFKNNDALILVIFLMIKDTYRLARPILEIIQTFIFIILRLIT